MADPGGRRGHVRALKWNGKYLCTAPSARLPILVVNALPTCSDSYNLDLELNAQ